MHGEDVRKVRVTRGWFSARIHVDASPSLQLRCLPKGDTAAVTAAVECVPTRHRALPGVRAALTWHQDVLAEVTRAQSTGRWITRESRQT